MFYSNKNKCKTDEFNYNFNDCIFICDFIEFSLLWSESAQNYRNMCVFSCHIHGHSFQNRLYFAQFYVRSRFSFRFCQFCLFKGPPITRCTLIRIAKSIFKRKNLLQVHFKLNQRRFLDGDWCFRNSFFFEHKIVSKRLSDFSFHKKKRLLLTTEINSSAS